MKKTLKDIQEDMLVMNREAYTTTLLRSLDDNDVTLEAFFDHLIEGVHVHSPQSQILFSLESVNEEVITTMSNLTLEVLVQLLERAVAHSKTEMFDLITEHLTDMSVEHYRKFYDVLNWGYISENANLEVAVLTEFSDRIDWARFVKYNETPSRKNFFDDELLITELLMRGVLNSCIDSDMIYVCFRNRDLAALEFIRRSPSSIQCWNLTVARILDWDDLTQQDISLLISFSDCFNWNKIVNDQTIKCMDNNELKNVQKIYLASDGIFDINTIFDITADVDEDKLFFDIDPEFFLKYQDRFVELANRLIERDSKSNNVVR